MRLIDLLERKGNLAVTVPESATVAEAIQTLHQYRVGAVVIPSDTGTPQGILSERDVIRFYAQGQRDFENMRVKDVMTTAVVVGSPHDGVDAVLGIMTEKRFRHMPVVEDGKIVGVVSIGDLVKSKLEEIAQEAQALREYINS